MPDPEGEDGAEQVADGPDEGQDVQVRVEAAARAAVICAPAKGMMASLGTGMQALSRAMRSRTPA